MKWLRYSLWTIVAMAAVAGVCIAWKRHEERNRREVEQWLTSIVIPKFELRDQTLDEAVVMFNQVIEATPNHAHDLKIVIAPEKETQKLFRRALKMKDLVESPSAGSRGPEIAPDQTAGREARFNKRETNTSLRELILHFKYRDALSYRIRGRQVILYVHHMPGTVFPLRTRIFQLSQLGGEILLEATPDRDRHGDVINAGPVLAYNGYTLYEGGFARYDTRTGNLEVRTTEEMLDHVAKLFGRTLTPSRTSRFRSWLRYNAYGRWFESPLGPEMFIAPILDPAPNSTEEMPGIPGLDSPALPPTERKR